MSLNGDAFFEALKTLPAELREKLGEILPKTEIKKGGGTRRFFRVTWSGAPAICCWYDDAKKENLLYAGIAKFLEKLGVPVPCILWEDKNARILLMEDLGEIDLWSLKTSRAPETLPAYKSALEGLALLHREGIKQLAGLEIMRDGFNATYYRWEQDYFIKNALEEGHKLYIAGRRKENFEQEIFELTQRLLALPKNLVHRDCQSQNALWYHGKTHFIDFQGMRVGTGLYDVASLLFDPYVDFDPADREQLLGDYCADMEWDLNEEVLSSFYDAASQRLMQAIGAYFFLSNKMGKRQFRKFALPALKRLESVSKLSKKLPETSMLASELIEREEQYSKTLQD